MAERIENTTLASENQARTLANEIALVFEYTYPRDGFDPIAGSVNGKPLPGKDTLQAAPGYQAKPTSYADYEIVSDLFEKTYEKRTAVIQLLTFFGIPNRITRPRIGDAKLKPIHVVKNLFGWHDSNSPIYQKILNYTLIKPILTLAFNVVTIVAKTAFNIIKLVTEFVPSLISKLSGIGAAKLNTIRNEDGPLSIKKAVATVGFGLLKGIQYLSKAIHLLGRTITSPVNSVRAGLAYGDKWYKEHVQEIDKKIQLIKEGKQATQKNPGVRRLTETGHEVEAAVYEDKHNKSSSPQSQVQTEESLLLEKQKILWKSRGIKAGLTILSVAITATFYVILFPLGLKMLALKAPAAASTAGEFIVKAGAWIDKVPYVSNVVNGILTAAKFVLGPGLKAVGVEASSAIGTVVSATVAGVSIASVAENVRKRAANIWYGLKSISVKKDVTVVGSDNVQKNHNNGKKPVSGKVDNLEKVQNKIDATTKGQAALGNLVPHEKGSKTSTQEPGEAATFSPNATLN